MIPDVLKNYNHWVCWQKEKRNGKITKVPKNARTGNNADSTDPATWSTFQNAQDGCQKFGLDGIGFCLDYEKLPLTGIDIDNCIEDGRLSDLAKEIVSTINSYTQVSPSGKGLRIFAFGPKPGPRCKNPQMGVELYTQERFLTITDNHLPDSPEIIEHRPAEIAAVYHKLFGEPKQEPKPRREPQPVSLADTELLELAFSSANGEKFKNLWDGLLNGYESQSEADQALCNMLVFWTGGDAGRVDYLFRQSGLYREKWDEKRGERTYGQITIETALKGVTEYYEPADELEPLDLTGIKKTEVDIPPEILWPHYTLDQGLELYDQDIDWLIYGLYQLQSIGMAFGDGGSGKTYFSLKKCVDLACGLPVLSVDYPHYEPKKVLYFISEGRQEFFPRVLAAINGLGISTGQDTKELKELVNQNMVVVPEVPQLFARNAKRSMESYLDYWTELGSPHIDFVVIDTLHRAAVGSDENSEKDANIILENVRWFTRETGAAVELIHHSNKSGGYRGSSAYRNDIDVMIKVEGVARTPRTVTIDKERDCPPDGPIVGTQFEMQFYIDDATKKSYVRLFPNDLGKLDTKEIEQRIEREIIRTLQQNSEKGLTQNQLCILVKGKKQTVIEVAKRLVDEYKIVVEPKGNSFVYKSNF